MNDKISNITLQLAKEYTDEHGGGGGGGTTNYNELDHLPTVNGVEFKGTMTGDTLGLVDTDDLGDLATKDSASGNYTPQGSVSVSQGTDTTTKVNSITAVGTLPSFSVSEETLIFDAGSLPTKGADTDVVTASGTRTATFSGTQASISVS